ncbi:MAG TPA: YggS family pyridoxal phosphate-dependent enzyme [Chloroflexota bacterium]|nr:YggS family pyridoxal phosphate-dependent enzyme [Chloroflexota bacterium]
MIRGESSIAENLARVRDSIAQAALRAGRQADEITLIGISKTQPAEAIAAAVRAGLRHVGENRVQEAADKLPTARQLLIGEATPVFHMVGHLQSNKAGSAVGLFDRVDSVHSLKLAQALSRHLNGARDLPVLIEVYVGDDLHRPGLRPDQAIDVVGGILEVPGLRVEGLMTVAPLGGDARTAFVKVRELKVILSKTFPRVHFGVLSMGMSDDYLVAIEEGSTEVRIGTALFGPRMTRF